MVTEIRLVEKKTMVKKDMTDSLIDKGILSEDEVSILKEDSPEQINALIKKYFT